MPEPMGARAPLAGGGRDCRLECRELSLAYGPRRIIDNLSLKIEAGSWTAIVGPNGCGKSTLLRALGGLLSPRAGTVSLEGRPLDSWPRRERAKRVAWLSQGAPPSDLSASQCVALGRFAHTGWLGHVDRADETAIREAMSATGSLALAERRLSTLSGGERQRIHLARVLAVQASVLLLDEPTTHLDPPHQEEIARLLKAQAHDHEVTVLCAIHDLSLALMADRVIVLAGQRLVGHGTVAQALAENWLSQAFGTPIRITSHEGAYLWHPQSL